MSQAMTYILVGSLCLVLGFAMGSVFVCEHHAFQIEGLMKFLGTHVAITAAPEGAQCSNCLNEAAKRKA